MIRVWLPEAPLTVAGAVVGLAAAAGAAVGAAAGAVVAAAAGALVAAVAGAVVAAGGAACGAGALDAAASKTLTPTPNTRRSECSAEWPPPRAAAMVLGLPGTRSIVRCIWSYPRVA